MFESSQETIKVDRSGSTLIAPKRIHSIILTPDGTNEATATISWSDVNGNVKYINLASSDVESAIYTPSKPVAVGGRDVTAIYSPDTSVLNIGTSGSTLEHPHTNLVCKVTVH